MVFVSRPRTEPWSFFQGFVFANSSWFYRKFRINKSIFQCSDEHIGNSPYYVEWNSNYLPDCWTKSSWCKMQMKDTQNRMPVLNICFISSFRCYVSEYVLVNKIWTWLLCTLPLSNSPSYRVMNIFLNALLILVFC